MAKFDQIQPALARFVFADKRLGLSEAVRQIDLTKSSFIPDRAKQGLQSSLLRRVKFLFWHPKSGYGWLTHIPNSDILWLDMQQLVLEDFAEFRVAPFSAGLLKWIGNKQRMAHVIASNFPTRYNRYFEPFVGSGAVLATLAPHAAFASDAFVPLIDIWSTLSNSAQAVKTWYADRWTLFHQGDKFLQYDKIKASYNTAPNGADLLFLCRSCYGGVVRFRKSDGYMSTPCGIHDPISPHSFNRRVDEWARRLRGTEFRLMDYEEAMEEARPGDLIYCDPPYTDSQTILYGAQNFNLVNLFRVIERCRRRGVHVALSIDGTKKSGKTKVNLPVPNGLFERELFIECGRSMLRRFQLNGQTLEHEIVTDRLLLTY